MPTQFNGTLINNWVTVCDAFYGSEGCTYFNEDIIADYQCSLNFRECMATVMLYTLPSPRFVFDFARKSNDLSKLMDRSISRCSKQLCSSHISRHCQESLILTLFQLL